MSPASLLVLRAWVRLHARTVASGADPCGPRARDGQGGQATAEYALVLLGVAAIALLLTAWAARSGKIGELFDAVVDSLIHKVG